MRNLKRIVIVLVLLMMFSSFVMAEEIALGTQIGTFEKTDESIFVNGQRVQGYLIDNDLAICIEDLKQCGFNGIWDPKKRKSSFDYVGLDRKENLDMIVNSKITGNSIVHSDIEIILAGDKIKSYSTNGYSLVKINDLRDFAQINKDESVYVTMNNDTLNEHVEIKDRKLEQIIKKKLNQPLGSLYLKSLKNIESIIEDEDQVKYLEELMPWGAHEEIEIESLDGIQYLSNLEELELSSIIKSEDKEFIKKVSNIKKLKLKILPEYKLDFLKELKSIEELEIETTESVKAIGELSSLKKLTIKTKAYDLSPLANLKNLTELSIEVYDIRNPEFFKFLVDLDSLRKIKLQVQATDFMATKLNTEYLKELNHFDEFKLVLSKNLDYNVEIKDLSFLRDFTGLTGLTISQKINKNGKINNIEDIAYLENLKELEINPGAFKLEDIAFLKNLSNLEKLDLRQHDIKDFGPLMDMTSLKELYLPQNISSLKPLANLKNLKVLKLSSPVIYWYNKYEEQPTENIKHLKDVLVLQNLTKLENIELAGFNIDDISWINSLKHLKVVKLSRNNIADISSMKGLENIEILDLSRNNITDVSALRDMNNIEELYLYKNNIRNIEAIVPNEKLKNLDVSYNKISKLPRNLGLPNLEVLQCTGNKINTITFNEKMLKLKGLNLSENRLKTINNVSNTPNVVELGLSKNNIKDIGFLKDLISLKELDIELNKIENIDVLTKLYDLERLGIGGNRIDDISPIYKLNKLKSMNIDNKNKDEILNIEDNIWEKHTSLQWFFVDGGGWKYTKYNDPTKEGSYKATYKGKIFLNDNVTLPKEGLVVSILKITGGGMGGSKSESVIKEIFIPYGKKSVEYEFDINNKTRAGRLWYELDVIIDNKRYELKTNTDFKYTDTKKGITIDDSDIQIFDRAKITGKIILDDEILNMEVDSDYFGTREIAIYARINDEKRRAIATADLKQKEITYELYLPKKFAGEEFTLEYSVKDYGYFDFRAHLGIVGDIIFKGFLTEDKTLSPNIDESKMMMFDGEDILIEDINIEM